MLKTVFPILPLDPSFAHNDSNGFYDSCFKFLDIVGMQLDAARTIGLQNQVLVLSLALRVKTSIILRNQFFERNRIAVKHGLF